MTRPGDAETTPAQGTPQDVQLKVSFNLLAPENTEDPSALFKELREKAPVYWAQELNAWLITRHTDVTNCFRDPRLSANRSGLTAYQMNTMVGEEPSREFVESVKLMMMMRDGLPHVTIRRQASPAFSPQSIDVFLPSIRRIMQTLVKQLEGRRQMDLVKEISYELPLLVITEFLDLPATDRLDFHSWSKDLADLSSPSPGMDMKEVAHKALDAATKLRNYLGKYIKERQENPGQDGISRIVHAGKLPYEELVANIFTLISAGHLTVTDLLSNGIYDLLRHPDQIQLLRDNRSLVRPAVEEMLRYSTSVPFMTRLAAETFELHGHTIEKGQMVLLGIAAANRDPEVFPDPERFDISRDFAHHKHLSFAFGPHHCLGAGLARRELEVAIETLVDHLPGLRLDETRPPVRKNQGLIFRGFNSLPVAW